MERNWRIRPGGSNIQVQQLAQALNIDEVLANLLIQRGIKSFHEAKSFFRPDLNDLHDPFLMKDMDKAITRLNKAIKNKERILVYGDYDVDGTTSVALVYSFLRELYGEDNLDYYIPDRYSQGYGISVQGVEYAADNNFGLVIALDCGIKAVEKVQLAKKKGVDFIICDHHTAGDVIPDAVAVLDPKRLDCQYPFKHLSGCGVGYKMLQAYIQQNNLPSYLLEPYLDLLCVSIASDIVPITGENRILAHFGLLQLNQNPSPGLKSIIQISNLDQKEITISDIVFKIGPRINAAGRMESGRKSVDLLTSQAADKALMIMDELNTFNDERKNLDRNITLEALDFLHLNPDFADKKTTVLFKPEWHKGVIGIVASRLIETYYRPTVILTESNGMATGSARTVEGYDVYQAIESCSDLLENFGGHTYAAGLTMKIENVPLFSKRFEEFVCKTISQEQRTPIIDVDAIINLSDITPKFYRILKQFAPFGPENMSPVFVSRNVTDYGTGRIVGKNADHMKLELMQNDIPNLRLPAIGFNMSEFFEIISQRIPFNVCYSVVENEFKGKTTLQLMLRDIKIT